MKNEGKEKQNNQKPKTRIFKLLAIGILSVLILSALAYFVPRWFVAMQYIRAIDSSYSLEKVELENQYLSESIDVKFDIVELKLPAHEGVDKSAYYHAYGDSELFHGYGYVVVCNIGINIEDNYFEENSTRFLFTKSFNEYNYRLAQMYDEKPSLFQPLDKVDSDYMNYFNKYLYFAHLGNYYASYEKDNYAFCIIVNQKTEDDEGSNMVRINIYDKNDNFNEIAFVYVQRDTAEENDKAFSSEEILFILDSIVINLPEFKQTD